MGNSGENFDPKSLPVKDSGTAPTTFIDGIHGLNYLDGIVVFNLTRTVVPAPSAGGADTPYVDTVERLAVPINAFIRIAHFLHDQLGHMEEAGLITQNHGGEPGKDG